MLTTVLLCEPDVGKAPLHPPEAEQEFALVELHVNVTAPLVWTFIADAVNDTTGGGGGGGAEDPPPPPHAVSSIRSKSRAVGLVAMQTSAVAI